MDLVRFMIGQLFSCLLLCFVTAIFMRAIREAQATNSVLSVICKHSRQWSQSHVLSFFSVAWAMRTLRNAERKMVRFRYDTKRERRRT
jgi:hypothetical protein